MPSHAQTIALAGSGEPRLDYLDAARAFALLLGIVFHACVSFMPVYIGWAVQDVSTSPLVGAFMLVSHSFRMEMFFLLAGFFGHLTLHRKGAGQFVRSRSIRILVPFVVGWFLFRPLLVSGWIMGNASMRGDVDVWAGLVGGVQSLSRLPAGIFTGSHLWFLYYLAMITALTLAARALLSAIGSRKAALLRRVDALVAWFADCPGSLSILAIPTAGMLWCMSGWGMDTPDKSLFPHFPVLAIDGGFFVLGWILSRQRELISRFARLSPLLWMQAAVGIASIFLLDGIESNPAHSHYLPAHAGFAFGYALTMWSLVFLTIGIFQKLCSRSNAMVRYIADSSYWMYLLHLPVVIWLQVAVAELTLHWSFKLAFVSIITMAISLFTYDLFVRSTFLGWVLNGRRRERVLVPWAIGIIRRLRKGRPLSPAAGAQ